MAVRAFELRDVAEVQRVAERAVAFVAHGALVGILVADVDRVLEHPVVGLPPPTLISRRVWLSEFFSS
jgi:hypothetical protein